MATPPVSSVCVCVWSSKLAVSQLSYQKNVNRLGPVALYGGVRAICTCRPCALISYNSKQLIDRVQGSENGAIKCTEQTLLITYLSQKRYHTTYIRQFAHYYHLSNLNYFLILCFSGQFYFCRTLTHSSVITSSWKCAKCCLKPPNNIISVSL